MQYPMPPAPGSMHNSAHSTPAESPSPFTLSTRWRFPGGDTMYIVIGEAQSMGTPCPLKLLCEPTGETIHAPPGLSLVPWQDDESAREADDRTGIYPNAQTTP